MSKVQTLPPTDQIKDPQLREFCEALSNAWNLRNGNIDAGEEERFITKGELTEATAQALIKMLSGAGSIGSNPTPGGSVGGGMPGPNAASIWLDDLLKQRIQLLTIPATADIRKKVANAEAGMLSTRDVQATKDMALASAVNTLWATLSGPANPTSIIQDGALAQAVPSTAIAARWTQVQSAVTDPNNPAQVVNTAAVREDFRTYASTTDAALNAAWTIRVNVNNVITGIGLGITTTGGTPSSAFNVMADQFNVYHPTTNVGHAAFRVDTLTGAVFLQSAFIEDASIGSAKIAEYLQSRNFINGQTGWIIHQNGYAEFQDVWIRGTSRVGRTNVDGAVRGSVWVPNGIGGAPGTATVGHGSGRIPVVTIWSGAGAATLTDVNDQTFTIRLDLTGGGTVSYSYW